MPVDGGSHGLSHARSLPPSTHAPDDALEVSRRGVEEEGLHGGDAPKSDVMATICCSICCAWLDEAEPTLALALALWVCPVPPDGESRASIHHSPLALLPTPRTISTIQHHADLSRHRYTHADHGQPSRPHLRLCRTLHLARGSHHIPVLLPLVSLPPRFHLARRLDTHTRAHNDDGNGHGNTERRTWSERGQQQAHQQDKESKASSDIRCQHGCDCTRREQTETRSCCWRVHGRVHDRRRGRRRRRSRRRGRRRGGRARRVGRGRISQSQRGSRVESSMGAERVRDDAPRIHSGERGECLG